MGMKQTVREGRCLLNRVVGENLLDKEWHVPPKFDGGFVGSLRCVVDVVKSLPLHKRKLSPVMLEPLRTMLLKKLDFSFEGHGQAP